MDNNNNKKNPTAANNAPQNAQQQQQDEARIPVNGFGQIVEMLKAADPAFRESLLRRLATKDKALVSNLRRNLADSGF